MISYLRTRGERRERARTRQAARTRYYRTITHCDPADAARLGRRHRDLRQPCSCYACGNARRHFGGPPIGELREAPLEVPE